jgi:glycogen operon protein
MGRTQHGNNNAYCQDNELAWTDWTTSDQSLLEFTRALIALRRAHVVFRQESFFSGRSVRGNGTADLAWFRSDGAQMAWSDWSNLNPRTIAMYLSGKDIRQVGAHGEQVVDDSFLVVMHGGLSPSTLTLPSAPWATSYEVVIDNSDPTNAATLAAGSALDVPAVAFMVLRAT